MSEMIASAGVPEVNLDSGSRVNQSAPPEFSGKWSDFSKDMAAIAKEQGVPPEGELGPLTVEPVQPEPNQPPPAPATPQPETQPAPQVLPGAAPEVPVKEPEIPEKFKGADGKLDQEKLMKSYLEAEKTLKRAQNAKPQPQGLTPEPQANTQPAAPQGPLTQFELQVAQDIFTGGGFTEQQAISIARTQVKLAEARHKADVATTFGRVAQLEETLTAQQQRQELESLAKTNPEVLSPKGFESLVKIREDNPWVNASPEPWKAAMLIFLGQKGMAGTVNIPNPIGGQQTAPPLPVTPSQPIQTPTKLNSPKDVEAYVKTLTPEQEAKFWQLQGLKWESPRKQYMGI